MKIKIVILALICILFVGIFTCEYDNQPFIKMIDNDIKWLCDFPNNKKEINCFTYVIDINEKVTQVNPEMKFIEGIGIANEFFTTNNSKLVVSFTDRNIYSDTSYDFYVVCNYDYGAIEIFTGHIVPTYKDLYQVSSGLLWGKRNAVYIVTIFGIAVLIYLLYVFFKWVIER